MSVPPGHWLLGHIPALRTDPLRLLDACEGPTVPLRLGRTVWLLLEPADALHVLERSGDRYSKGRTMALGRRLYGNSLLVSEGAEHQRQVKQIGGLFFRHAAASYLDPAVAIAERWADRWQDGERIDLWSAVNDLLLAVSSRAVFGDDWLPGWLRPDGNAEADAMLSAFDDAMAHVARQNFSLLPLPDWVPLPTHRRYLKAIAKLDHVVAHSVERRRRGEASGGLLDHLLEARDESGQPLAPEQVRDQALILVLGGYESFSSVLCWALLLLDRHDEVRRRLLAEVNQVVGDRLPTGGDVAKLSYTSRVFSEALRLYPPPWLIPRTAVTDDELPSGLRLRKGTMVFLSPYRTQRDGRYFPRPLEFDPERFAPGVAPTWPDGAYFPFGGGPRRCLGESTARTQGVLLLATLCRRWRFRVEAEELPAPRPLLTLRPPTPLWVQVSSTAVARDNGSYSRSSTQNPTLG